MKVAAILVAAGRGSRAGLTPYGPKQYFDLGGRPVLWRTAERFLSTPGIGPVIVVIHPDDHAMAGRALDGLLDRVLLVEGGATRQASVRCGLEALAEVAPEIVLIHDAVRPFVSSDAIQRVVADIDPKTGAILALPVADTLKRSDGDLIDVTVDRSGLFGAQTPQGFPYGLIREAHTKASRDTRTAFTDDASIAEWAGIPVRLVPGDPENVKLTLARELTLAAERFRGEPAMIDVRTGNGYDVHKLVPGDGVTLCGVFIEHDQALLGHSDADVGFHALTDALLATCGAGDIGTHFPPSDPQWRGVASRVFLKRAVEIVEEHKGRICNVDVTLICEAPKVGPHRSAMVEVIADVTGLEAERISIKATTNETIGFIGRREGIAAIATASVVYGG
ncbi:bifunctional 2-C-methyl-D-erythritol 4-phosphate cytidylyltransferase/2-C-methyl-D-erythritol 2,4-cyclodiphosphate synthase [Aureimonas phyllosphaerae]|uniref:Bifunctional enzyme IspD/IspF n=1 Tax=Aureimonas phyllosphaerae TaxID=1166078 RepID=A0A7W6FTC0_9HYPH|nr:bifunctional 2-C-methyl-D-erythritol 4-phosphate cytidylyltransferase/2-C-methyl-D-erythritol 2,4-cyclodiphosphate synthase [Aureimonas phyllosphaerae]MBB3934861.1 2-C-methyl-D-erythritol 4-phosphate cytidylyltransferase/2-C-methyl-D-erythritol 2,4-cyclodiphosphate synthase [Aureimonas phyllosphaerae]MBB3957924.1 2-C-methyl-D-erythritol 4-phosphate cytidylyltransferase/2-C-methyl-D-erythritol 2,4-cyclodiphosphate synthase [Aureimonas phyllosphaerae]SFF44187.1 2-C-methyl-D-erythritol 2,4-cyclo